MNDTIATATRAIPTQRNRVGEADADDEQDERDRQARRERGPHEPSVTATRTVAHRRP